MGDASLITALGNSQTAQAMCQKSQGQCDEQGNQDLFAMLFQSLSLLGQGQLTLDNNQNLPQGNSETTDSEIADLLSFNQSIDWGTFSLINSLAATSNQTQLNEINSLLGQLSNDSNLDGKMAEVVNVLNSSQQPQQDLLSLFTNLSKEEQQLLYTQLKLIVEAEEANAKTYTANNIPAFSEKSQNFEEHSEDLKLFLKSIEKEFELKPSIIEDIVRDFGKLKLNNDSSIQNIDSGYIQSIIKTLYSNQQNDNLASEQLPADGVIAKDPDISSLDSAKLVIQNINLNSNSLDNTQMVSKQQVVERLNTGQNFTSELGKVMIKNLQLPNGSTETKIQLYPQELGQIDVKISANNGQITAQFIAETTMGRELLESQISQLKNSLIQQGFQVDKIEVQQQSTTSTNVTQGLKSGFNFSGQQPHKQYSNGQAYYHSNSFVEESEDFSRELLSLSGIDYTV